MTMKNLTQHVRTSSTPQTEALNASQIPNSAGGFTFAASSWQRLTRFLLIGSEGGSYYIGEKDLTKQSLTSVRECLVLDGKRTVDAIRDISHSGRAAKNTPAILALAVALREGSPEVKVLAKAAVPLVCRIPTHLFELAEALDAMGGWGPSTRKALGSWYLAQTPDRLAQHITKYQSRDGWSHADVLRKIHLKAPNSEYERLFRWSLGHLFDTRVEVPVTGGKIGNRVTATTFKWIPNKGSYESFMKEKPSDDIRMVWAFESAKAAKTEQEIVALINGYNLPRECIPTSFLNSIHVWNALLSNGEHTMPLTAMIRNLGKMTSLGMLKPLSKATHVVVSALTDREQIKKARLHPLNLLIALSTYSQGHGDKGSLNWIPSPQVVTALESAIELSFKEVEPTGKRFLFALDVSSSMKGHVPGTNISSAQVGSMLALTAAKIEQQTYVHGFAGSFVPLNITAKSSYNSARMEAIRNDFGTTDCAIPMQYALKENLEVDVFVFCTDNETYLGSQHPSEALKAYRKATGINAKLIVLATTANAFSIADPSDPLMLDVAGFDTDITKIVYEFAKM